MNGEKGEPMLAIWIFGGLAAVAAWWIVPQRVRFKVRKRD